MAPAQRRNAPGEVRARSLRETLPWRTIGAQLTILTPEQDEAVLREAGFSDVTRFYVGFTFRGWVAYA